MKTLRFFLAPVAGAVMGFLVDLALIKGLALLLVAVGPLSSGKLALRLQMLGEQVVIFLLCGLMAGVVTGRLAGRHTMTAALGMQAGLIAWLLHACFALWQGGADEIRQAPGVQALVYAAALAAVLAGGWLGARAVARPRRRAKSKLSQS